MNTNVYFRREFWLLLPFKKVIALKGNPVGLKNESGTVPATVSLIPLVGTAAIFFEYHCSALEWEGRW